MTFRSFFGPLVLHYALVVLQLGLGLQAFSGTGPGLRDVSVGSWWLACWRFWVAPWCCSRARRLCWLRQTTAPVVVVTGLLPIVLGAVSLVRWSRL